MDFPQLHGIGLPFNQVLFLSTFAQCPLGMPFLLGEEAACIACCELPPCYYLPGLPCMYIVASCCQGLLCTADGLGGTAIVLFRLIPSGSMLLACGIFIYLFITSAQL